MALSIKNFEDKYKSNKHWEIALKVNWLESLIREFCNHNGLSNFFKNRENDFIEVYNKYKITESKIIITDYNSGKLL
jgi:hypothetical protein